MPTPSRLPLHSLRLSVLALSLVLAGAARAQAPLPPDSEAVRRLASDDPQVQASRWGTLALMAGKPWLTFVPGEIATVWRLAGWVVPGASMRFQRGFCAATACQATDYVVQYDDKAGQLQFFDNGTMAYTGHVEADGALRMKGTGLLGVLTAETLRHDPASGTLYANAHALKAGTPQQLASATGGFAPAVAAAAQASAPVAAAKPATAPAPAPAADAELRAELASMKARVEQLSRQIEQQPAPAPAPARPPTPAEARAKAAEEKRQAEARAREEREAKAAEAQRLAAERKARAEEEKRQQAEARAREIEAQAAEARRQAEERRAQQEASRRQAEEQRARQEAERREAAERAREAEAARVREAQAAAARQQAAAQAPRPAAAEGPVRPGLYSSGTGYEVDVKLAGDSLVLTERAYNRTSEYRPTSPGSRVYGYRNPNTGTHFALTVQDNTTLVASRFSGSGEVLPNGTPLRFAGGAPEARPVSRSTFTAMEERAQHYLRLAQTDPANAQAWSFCGMAAMAQAHGQNEQQVRQAAMALKSIATTSRSPCGEVITDSLWRSLP